MIAIYKCIPRWILLSETATEAVVVDGKISIRCGHESHDAPRVD